MSIWNQGGLNNAYFLRKTKITESTAAAFVAAGAHIL